MLAIKDLPVYRHKMEIIDALAHNQVIIVESPTGSGKTTQIPLILKEAGYDQSGIIGITQPRRIATLSVCEFIRRQIEDTDSYCGYTMRFADTTTDKTRIKIMTDGILLQELKDDPFLSHYSVIMVDEAHERSLNIDFILGLLKQITAERKDLKVIISSATINTDNFSRFFSSAPIISIDAKVYPITIKYVEKPKAESPGENPWDKPKQKKTRFFADDWMFDAIYRIVEQNVKENKGDILIFLSGEFAIKTMETLLLSATWRKRLQLYPLYGRLSKEEQERVFTPTEQGKTKVVIATNIAETSITIDGITTVIDSGIAKVNFYNQKDFTSSLVPLPISQSSAKQRAGRSGRTQPGTCYRLYKESDLIARPEFTTEEILRSDLTEVALRMSYLGIYDYEHFPFITEPKRGAINSAEETLLFIGAIDKDRHLTAVGEKMVLFPLLPRHARVIVEAINNYPSVLDDVIIAIAFLSTKGPYLLPKDQEIEARNRQAEFQDQVYGDFVGYLKLFKRYSEVDPTAKAQEHFCKRYFLDLQTMNEIVHIYEQLGEIVSKMGIPLTTGGNVSDYLCCLAAGLLQYVCYNVNGYSYRTLTANDIYIHPGSAWFKNPPKFLLAGEIVQTSRMFARTVSPLKAEWLDKIDPKLKDALMHKMKDGKAESAKTENATSQNEGHNGQIKLFDRFYDLVHKKGKNKQLALIPIQEIPYLIKKGFARGSVKRLDVQLVIGGMRAASPISLRDIVQEGGIIKSDGTLLPSARNHTYTLPDDQNELLKALADLFTPIQNGKKTSFGYLGLNCYEENIFATTNVSNISACVDISYASLTRLEEFLTDKKQRQIVAKIKKRLDDLEDF